MNKRSWISVVVIFIVWMGLDFLIHGSLLHSDYAQYPQLYRTEQDSQQYFPFMLLAHILMAIGFVWIYNKGKEAKPYVGQGIRYGIAIAILTVIPTYLIYYVVLPLPSAMVFKQIVYSTLEVLILGIIVARLNQ
jgi:hypothetical protein